MADSGDAIRKHKKGLLSNPFNRSSSKDREPSKKNKETKKSAKLDWSLESPPIIFHGSANDSTGALMSGQMFLEVNEDVVEVASMKGNLQIHTKQKRPYQSHCAECVNQYKEISSWVFISGPTTLKKGKHSYPFSVLLSGDHPASMDTTVMSLAWEFKVEAQYVKDPTSPNRHMSTATFERVVPVKRSIPEPEVPHNSVRVFPPTNIKASASYNTIIHPSGNNKVTFRLDGLVTHNEKVKTVDLWKLKKITWKLEETVKTSAPACDRHALAATTAANGAFNPEEPVATPRSEVRLLGEKSIFDGWKTSYSGHDGSIELEFDYAINQYKPNSRDLKFACDSSHYLASSPNSPLGVEISVTHQLLVEVVVSKEFAPEEKPQASQPTGTGRILRMHYGIVMTDHPGMGVSWDNEAPPTYEDVPPSPPGYDKKDLGDDEDVPSYEESEESDEEGLELTEARRASVEPLDLTIQRTHE